MGWLTRWLGWIGLGGKPSGTAARADTSRDAHDLDDLADAPERLDAEPELPEAVTIEIGPEIDLHVFSPKETRKVVDGYLHEAHAKGLREVRIVHGRGKGVQRQIVRSALREHPLVESFRDSLPSGGGWGATIAVLKP